MAKVAMAHGINANVVHRWRQMAREGKAAPAKTGEFIALLLTPPAEATSASADIRVELRRGPVMTRITWPASAATDFAAWTREMLR